MKPTNQPFDITKVKSISELNKFHFDALFDRIELMANQTCSFLNEEPFIVEKIAEFGITKDSKYFLVCYFLSALYVDYIQTVSKLFKQGCQIDFTDNQFMIKDSKTGELITNPDVFINEKHNAQVYCKTEQIPKLRTLAHELALAESVLRMALSFHYWKVDLNVKEFADSMTYEWLNAKFNYMDDKPCKIDNPDEWINLTQLVLSSEDFSEDECELVLKDEVD